MVGLILALVLLAADDVDVQHDEDAGTVTVSIDDRETIVYQYGDWYQRPHLWPVRSPSGRELTVQHPDPYPHHRSLWIADKVQLEDGPVVDFYHADEGSAIRHERFTAGTGIRSELVWMADESTPVLDMDLVINVHDLGDGEYLLDMAWTLAAKYGEVTFHSDWVHYAWPYVRMHPQFSGQQGGTIIADDGRTGQEATNGEVARWIDYSNTVDGVTEGLAIFADPDGKDRKWVTREYGAFGPRRRDELSGTSFTLAEGESIHGHVGILVHRGDVETGRVAERYRMFTGETK